MDGHACISRRCLTLVGEAQLWYESLRPINVDWIGLQNQFKQQYSKIGNTRGQLFHAWRSTRFLCYMCHTGVVYDNISVVFMHCTFSINNKVGLVSFANIY